MRLWHGDCLTLMKDIDTNSVDMLLVDLPYGTTQCKWDSIISLKDKSSGPTHSIVKF